MSLFGTGVGTATCGDIKCDFCGTLHNEGNDAAEDYDGDSVSWTSFAGLTVCECCFPKIEQEVYRRMDDILVWYRRVQDRKRKRLEKTEELLKAAEGISEP